MKFRYLTRFALYSFLVIAVSIQEVYSTGKEARQEQLPNFVVIFCDDLGYGDIEPYGHPTIHTPNLNRLAHEGQRWTSFYVGASVCTPSRAALLTGRLPEFLPRNHGFDYYFGIPYSNDMDRVEGIRHRESCINPDTSFFQVPLIRDLREIERPANQHTITKRYTEEALGFINENQEAPFFLYLAHSMPHVPLFRSEAFEGISKRGIYGDVIEEIDWSVGEVCRQLKELGIERNTLVLFTSDNGPWLVFEEPGGSAGLLRGGKGGTFEGGMREPAIWWWPGRIKPGTVMEPGAAMDLFPTFCHLAGLAMPEDRIYDGYDLSPVLFGRGAGPRKEVIYYRGTEVFAIRKGAFKAHFVTQPEYGPEREKTYHSPPLLFHLEKDPSEKYNVAATYPYVIEEIIELKNVHEQGVEPAENQLEIIMTESPGYEKNL